MANQTVYVSGAAYAPGSNSITPTQPTGLAVGNLMVAVFYCTDKTNGVPSGPAGWTKVVTVADTTTPQQWAIYTKPVAAGDLTAANWSNMTFFGSGGSTLAIHQYSGAAGIENAAFSFGSATSGVIAAPATTTTASNEQALACFASNGGTGTYSTPTGYTARLTAPAGGSARIYTFEKNQATAGSVAAANSTLGGAATQWGSASFGLVPAATGAARTALTGTGTLTVTGQVTSGTIAPPPTPPTFVSGAAAGTTGTTTNVSAPAGLVAGNLLIALVGNHVAGDTTTTDAGWTLIVQPASTYRVNAYYKYVTAAEPASYTFTNGTAGNYIAAAVLQYSGAAAGAPVDVFATSSTTTSTATFPAVTTTAGGDAVILAVYDYNGKSCSTPAGYTARASQLSAGNESIYTFDTMQGAAGDTGTVTSTGSGVLAAGLITLAVKGTSTAASSTAYTGAASLSGSGALTAGTGTPRAAQTAALSGTGALTAAGAAGISGTATLGGIGSLAAAGAAGMTGTAALSGAGGLAVTGLPRVPGPAALAGSGTLIAAGATTQGGVVALSGTGSLTDTGVGAIEATASLSGDGSLTSTGAARPASSPELSGSGTLATDKGTPATTGAVRLGGGGQLTVWASTQATAELLGLVGEGFLAASGVARSEWRDITVTFTPRPGLTLTTVPRPGLALTTVPRPGLTLAATSKELTP